MRGVWSCAYWLSGKGRAPAKERKEGCSCHFNVVFNVKMFNILTYVKFTVPKFSNNNLSLYPVNELHPLFLLLAPLYRKISLYVMSQRAQKRP